MHSVRLGTRFGFLTGTALALILTVSITASAAPQNSNQMQLPHPVRARLQQAGRHAQAVDDDGRRHPFPRHAAGFKQHSDTIGPGQHRIAERACKARGNSQADDRAGAGPRRGGVRDCRRPAGACRQIRAASRTGVSADRRASSRSRTCAPTCRCTSPCSRVGGSICRRARSRCASGLLTAQARRRGSTRGQCRNRGGSQQQASRSHHLQTVRPLGGAQARPRRHRRALSESPQLPAALGRPRRGERARQGRDRISRHHRRRRARSEGLPDAEAQRRQRRGAGASRAEVHRDAVDLCAPCHDRARALQPRQPEHRLQARVRRRRRAEEDRGLERPPARRCRSSTRSSRATRRSRQSSPRCATRRTSQRAAASRTARCCATPATAGAKRLSWRIRACRCCASGLASPPNPTRTTTPRSPWRSASSRRPTAFRSPASSTARPSRRSTARTASSRLDAVLATMERWRWMPRDLGKTHVVLNIPDYFVRVYNNGEKVWQTRVVVGKPGHETPLLTETMKFITSIRPGTCRSRSSTTSCCRSTRQSTRRSSSGRG